jgi:hypothetical protein
MNTPGNDHKDAETFARILRSEKLPGNINIGKFLLKGQKGAKDTIQYNRTDIDLLKHLHEYTFPIFDGELQVSLQLYKNVSNHYRLFCYTRIHDIQGMPFSLNLTTQKESNNVIFLTQKIKLSEQYVGSPQLAQAHRRQKQLVFSDLLSKNGFDFTDNNDLVLGIFDPERKQLVNTTAGQFLNDFIVISILKGHFQGNKGYQLEILPTYNKLDYIFTEKDDEVNNLPFAVSKTRGNRNIPLALRYKILKRDAFKCVACGHSPADGSKLHIDHKVPFSLGGLTEIKNLQTLCSDCNISKSNKYID